MDNCDAEDMIGKAVGRKFNFRGRMSMIGAKSKYGPM